ncbi:hypothetical protein SDC9_207749 [bioreactor metagenome]|uniref:Uncharacterized protein n=1 Tax=bioreactor metagenome TaxID=1076179 RepID=A0A645J9C3_9ZZZZ
MAGHILRADVNFDARDNPGIDQDFYERSAVILALADRLVVKYRAIDGLRKTGRGYDQLTVGTPGLFGLRNS